MEEIFEYRVSPTQMKPEDIEGVAEIKAAIRASINYHQAKMELERGDRFIEDMPKHNPGEIQELKRKYPRAAAFLEAERWANSGVLIKERLGSRACERILIGEDYNTVLEDMRRGLDAFYLAQQEG